jgi:hypothetical protein
MLPFPSRLAQLTLARLVLRHAPACPLVDEAHLVWPSWGSEEHERVVPSL